MSLETPDVVFQELTEPGLLRDSMALRFSNYRETKGLCLMESLDTASGLDVDEFDVRSRHFGLVANARGERRLIGSLRVTQPAATDYAEAVRAAVALAPTAVVRLEPRFHAALPSLHYSAARDGIAALVDQASVCGEPVLEAGRLVFARQCRENGLSATRRLAAFLVVGSAALLDRTARVSNVLANCHAHHEAFYGPVGFRRLANRSFSTEPALGLSHVVLHRRPEWASVSCRATCAELADAVERFGHARFDDFIPAAARARGPISQEVAA